MEADGALKRAKAVKPLEMSAGFGMKSTGRPAGEPCMRADRGTWIATAYNPAMGLSGMRLPAQYGQ